MNSNANSNCFAALSQIGRRMTQQWVPYRVAASQPMLPLAIHARLLGPNTMVTTARGLNTTQHYGSTSFGSATASNMKRHAQHPHTHLQTPHVTPPSVFEISPSWTE
jgi:hypothetical protein